MSQCIAAMGWEPGGNSGLVYSLENLVLVLSSAWHGLELGWTDALKHHRSQGINAADALQHLPCYM